MLGAHFGVGDVGLAGLVFLEPLLLELFELHLADRVSGLRTAARGKAFGGTVAQHEHQQPVIVPDPRADDLAVRVDRLLHAVERAVHCDILDALDAVGERGLPCGAEGLGAGLAAQVVGADAAHIDSAGGGLDRAGVGQRLDEAALALGGPAVVALAAAGDGGEGGELSCGGREAGGAGVFASGHGWDSITKPPSRKMWGHGGRGGAASLGVHRDDGYRRVHDDTFPARAPRTRRLSLLALAGCAGFGGGKDTAYVARDVDTLYAAAKDRLDRGNHAQAAALFDEVERQHPYSPWARRAQLMSAFSYYVARDYNKSIQSAQRFLSIHPGNKDAPYAYYLIALSYYEQISDVTRDQKITQQAQTALSEVIRRYPETAMPPMPG